MLNELNSISRTFHEVFSRKEFALVFAEMNEENFGNFVAIFQSAELALIFTSDRGQIFVDVANRDATQKRLPLNEAIHAIDRNLSLTNDMHVLADNLKTHYIELARQRM